VTASGAPDRLAAARSLLFVPGDRPDRYQKAARAGAGLVVVDLEDAVAAPDKPAARAAAVAWLRAGGEAVVRVNSEPALAVEDLAALAGLPGLLGVMVPKAEDPAVVEDAARAAGVGVIALIETALGLSLARSIAASPATRRLAIGSFDLSLDLGVAEGSTVIDIARFEVVLASRLAGLTAPVDTVTAEIGDGSAAGAAAARSRAEGFGAKLCIHPVQVAAVNAAFRPSAEEIEWARRIVAGAGTGAAVSVDGAMVDRPVVERAERILAAVQ
jgi:citrate lyase subunit beta/citryl-CoA lyase